MCDYVFLSPIYNTSLADGMSLYSLNQLKNLAQQKVIDRKVMAMGDVGINNLSQVKDLGFGGAVVLGDIWNKFSIHSTQDFKELIQHYRKLRRLAE